MTEKIDWYKEVLEIEPNSKVFFPLAKLLVKDNLDEEAIATLEKGLERHPEFLEARLLLIELLHHTGKTTECNVQISKLSQIFASYAGFWEAWAACLASTPDDADTAAILRVLAATFIAGPIQLHQVLNMGVEAILHEKNGTVLTEQVATRPVDENIQTACAKPSISEKRENEAEAVTFTSPQQLAPDTPLIIEETAQTVTDESSLATPEMTEIQNDVPEHEENANINLPEPAEEDEQPIELQTEIPVMTEEDEPEPVALSEDSRVQEPEEAESMEESPDSRADDSGLYQNSKPVEDEVFTPKDEKLRNNEAPESENGQDEEVEEPFSLRTRSMADVLADQGDLEGALDIYSELSAAASGKELEELNRRMVELREQMESQAEKNNNTDASTPGPENILGILEALARRVEARVNN